MTITATVITLVQTIHHDAGDGFEYVERDVYIRGDSYGRPMPHLDRIIKKHNLAVVNIIAYQQPTFAQSIRYHETGESI